jgi:DNA-binding IclR family transcriptional regulator
MGKKDSSPAKDNGSAGIQSIEVGIPLLRALAEARAPLTLTALATAVGMPPSKAHKYLTSFVRCGLIVQAEAGGPYELGPFALDLGLAAMRRTDIMDLAEPVLHELRDAVGATASMAVWANRGATIVRIADTPDVGSATIRIGTVMPLLTSAFGRCFATFLPPQITRKILLAEIAEPDGLAARHGLSDLTHIEALLAEFRSHGAAVAQDLIDPGRAAICAPVFDLNERMVAAIALIGDIGRLDVGWDAPPARELRTATRALSRRLGASSMP